MQLQFDEVFLTGANGWLGRQVLKTLVEGDEKVIDDFNPGNYKIYALVLPEDDLDFFEQFGDKVEVVKGDIRNQEDCEKFFGKTEGGNSLLIHTAGIIHPKRVKDFYDINYEGTKNLVETAKDFAVNKHVIISSNSPIGCNSSTGDLFDEKSSYDPYMGYGRSKMMMEKYLLGEIEDCNDITIIRPPWFYGEYMPERQLTFYKMIKNGKVPLVGDGTNLRSKANVKNITQGVLLAADTPISKGEIYWIADEKPYSMNEIIETVRDVLENEFDIECKHSVIKLPYFVSQVAEMIDYLLQKIGLYHQKFHVLSEMNKNIACKIDKAKIELDYQPKINLYDGIKDSIKRNNYWKKLKD